MPKKEQEVDYTLMRMNEKKKGEKSYEEKNLFKYVACSNLNGELTCRLWVNR